MYKLILKSPEKDYFRMLITADENDADYVTGETTLDKQDFDIVYPILKFFIDNYSGSHQFNEWSFDDVSSDVLKEMTSVGIDYYDLVNRLKIDIELPYGYDYEQPCHTFEHIRIEYFETSGKCFDVEL